MKIIKFTPQLTELIKLGKKSTTFRLFDDKNLSIGDEVILATRDGDIVREFGEAKINDVKVKTMGTLEPEDYEGHEPITDPLETYKGYYGKKVSSDTEVKVIRFGDIRLF